MLLDAHIGSGKDGGGEPHKSGQSDQKDIERIDKQLVMCNQYWAVPEHTKHQECRRNQIDEANSNVQLRGIATGPEQGKQESTHDGQTQNQQYFQFTPP